jgi:Copper binding proteins, plastocyanin/azurin family
MRRVLWLLAAVMVLAAPAVATARPTAVGVGEREWRIALYRPWVPAGLVKFNVRNFGEDGHDFVVRNARGVTRARLPEIPSGETASVTARLRRPGRFTVYCSLPGHLALGMRAALRVKRETR